MSNILKGTHELGNSHTPLTTCDEVRVIRTMT